MDGVKPRSAPLVLRRVILNGIPDFSRPRGVPPSAVAGGSDALGRSLPKGVFSVQCRAVRGPPHLFELPSDVAYPPNVRVQLMRIALCVVLVVFSFLFMAARAWCVWAVRARLRAAVPTSGQATPPGCRPYLQLFKSGALLFSSTWEPGTKADPKDGGSAETVRSYRESDGSVRFSVDVVVQVSRQAVPYFRSLFFCRGVCCCLHPSVHVHARVDGCVCLCYRTLFFCECLALRLLDCRGYMVCKFVCWFHWGRFFLSVVDD